MQILLGLIIMAQAACLVQADEPRLVAIPVEAREVYTRGDNFDIDIYLEVDASEIHSMFFCIQVSTPLYVGAGFLLSEELSDDWGWQPMCVLAAQAPDSRSLSVGMGTCSIPTVAHLEPGLVHLGRATFDIGEDQEQEQTAWIRIGVCPAWGGQPEHSAYGDFGSGDVAIADAEEITVRVQRQMFIRGDVNSDAKVDISDAVFFILVRFLHRGVILCGNAADANDDNELDIADPILNCFFLGGPPIPPPYPELGFDRNPSRPENTGCDGP